MTPQEQLRENWTGGAGTQMPLTTLTGSESDSALGETLITFDPHQH